MSRLINTGEHYADLVASEVANVTIGVMTMAELLAGVMLGGSSAQSGQ